MIFGNEVKSLDITPEFNIGEIVEARDRLWRIDNIKIRFSDTRLEDYNYKII